MFSFPDISLTTPRVHLLPPCKCYIPVHPILIGLITHNIKHEAPYCAVFSIPLLNSYILSPDIFFGAYSRTPSALMNLKLSQKTRIFFFKFSSCQLPSKGWAPYSSGSQSHRSSSISYFRNLSRLTLPRTLTFTACCHTPVIYCCHTSYTECNDCYLNCLPYSNDELVRLGHSTSPTRSVVTT